MVREAVEVMGMWSFLDATLSFSSIFRPPEGSVASSLSIGPLGKWLLVKRRNYGAQCRLPGEP